MNHRYLSSLTAAAVLSATAAFLTPAHAGPVSMAPAPPIEEECLSYDFFDLQYIFTSFDHLDDGHGVGANLSMGLFGNVYGTLSGSWSDSSLHGDSIDVYGITGGLGYVFPIAQRLHLTVEGGGVYGGTDGGGFNDDNWGFYVGPGLRYCLSPGTEFYANVYYVYFDGGYDTFDADIGFIGAITENLGVKVGGLLSDEQQSVYVGFRVYY